MIQIKTQIICYIIFYIILVEILTRLHKNLTIIYYNVTKYLFCLGHKVSELPLVPPKNIRCMTAWTHTYTLKINCLVTSAVDLRA